MTLIAAALLAAGRSARFGPADKLAETFRDAPLGLHAARALQSLDLAWRWAIVRDGSHPCVPGWGAAGFQPVVNADADEGMGASLRLAARCANEAGADALLICLADMPLVPPSHFKALATAWDNGGGIVASRDGELVSPPAIFPRERFGTLMAINGDKGARPLLREARLVDAPIGALADIDDEDALRRFVVEK